MGKATNRVRGNSGKTAQVRVRFSQADLNALDRVRGKMDRSNTVVRLIRQADQAMKRGKRPTLDATTAEGALKLLAEAAEYDSAAAIKLAEITSGRSAESPS